MSAASSPASEPLRRHWYAACLSRALGADAPVQARVLGRPIVLFRDGAGQARALLDRCCHRAVPLSDGRVVQGRIECGYHGWQFDGEGRCARVPGLPSDEAPFGGKACMERFETRERDGVVWVYGDSSAPPGHEPLDLGFGSGEPSGIALIDFGVVPASLENLVDNFMDSLHPAFTHRGLLYSDRGRSLLEIEVGPWRDGRGHHGVAGRYLGERAPTQGWIGWIFADRVDDPFFHEERFVAPSATQVEYRIGVRSRAVFTQLLTPIDGDHCRLIMVIRHRLRLPTALTSWLLRLLMKKLIRQDIEVLRRQRERLAELPEPPFRSTRIDALSLACVKMLRALRAGTPPRDVPVPKLRYPVRI